MPGMVCLVTAKPRRDAEAELERMLGVIRHESFYATRMWIDESLGVYVGWTARRGSFGDCEPIRNETGDVVLVFSGDEYPAPDTAERLARRGHTLDRAQASYLVHLYEDDPAFPAGLNGRFHGLLVDRRRRVVNIFNDRFSMHRLYYHESKDAVYFAAEAKAILAVRPELRAIDPRALGEFITLGCVVENRSLFKDVHVLPGGSLWSFDGSRAVTKTTYFCPQRWEEQPRLEGDAFYRETRDVFSSVLPRYFAGSEHIGMSLTGGLDTRMIMAWQRCPPGSLPCYTWGGTYRDCQDVIVAREVARACNQPAQVISMGTEFLSRFPHYADRAIWLTDACVDVSAAADVYMNEHARAIAPVRMTGLYGGEVLRHNRAFKPIAPLPGLFQPGLAPHFDDARETYAGLLRGHPVSFGVFRQAPWHHHGNLSLEETQVTVRSPFLDNDLVQTVFRGPDTALTSNDVSLRLIRDGNPALDRIPTDRGLGGRRRWAEIVAHAIKEFSFKAEYAYDYGMPQWLARGDHAVAFLHLERMFLGRHKALHYRVWYRQQLAGYVRDTLLSQKALSRAYLDRHAVERVVAGHLNGDRNYTTEIHKLLTLELLHRNFVDVSPAVRSADLLAAH